MSGLAALRPSTSTAQLRRDCESAAKWSEALTCYEQALQAEPEAAELHVGLVNCLRGLGHLRSALTHVHGAMRTLPPDQAARLAAHGAHAAWRCVCARPWGGVCVCVLQFVRPPLAGCRDGTCWPNFSP